MGWRKKRFELVTSTFSGLWRIELSLMIYSYQIPFDKLQLFPQYIPNTGAKA